MLMALVLVQQSALSAESNIEQEFARERKGFSCFEGSTDEPSCSGAGMRVYLRGARAVALDWTVEMSTKYVRQQYYFRDSLPVLVVETIHAKLDAEANVLSKPRLLSVTRYRLDYGNATMRSKEFLEHVEFLLRDFHEHRAEFTPCDHPNT